MELAFRNPHGGQGGLGGHIKTVATIPSGLENMHVDYISHADTRAFLDGQPSDSCSVDSWLRQLPIPWLARSLLREAVFQCLECSSRTTLNLGLVNHESRHCPYAHTCQHSSR